MLGPYVLCLKWPFCDRPGMPFCDQVLLFLKPLFHYFQVWQQVKKLNSKKR